LSCHIQHFINSKLVSPLNSRHQHLIGNSHSALEVFALLL